MMVYSCGTEVVVKRPGVWGNITAITIRFGLVTYEVTYYVDSVQQRIWVTEDEIMKNGHKIKLGFKNE